MCAIRAGHPSASLMVARGSTSQASTRSRELTLIELAIFCLYAASKDRNPINSQRYVIRLVGLTNLEAQKGPSLNGCRRKLH